MQIYALSGLDYTLPGSEKGRAFLASHGITFTEDLAAADLCFTKRFPLSKRIRLRAWWDGAFKKPLLVHTHEPRFCTLTDPGPSRRWTHGDVYVMNVYTGDVHLNNYGVYGWAIGPELPLPGAEHWLERRGARPLVALATYIRKRRRRALFLGGRNIDLTGRRQELLLRGHEWGLLNIHGVGWPRGVAQSSSREEGWHAKKLPILRRYRFNVAIESTAWPYYCSEKLWDAIAGGCLPVYWGDGTAIYEDFPRESFLDYSEYDGPDALFDHIQCMEAEEYLERLGRCVKAYNVVTRRFDAAKERERVLARFAERARQIVGSA